MGVRVLQRSAPKHGHRVDDIIVAVRGALIDIPESEDPPKRLILGFDSRGRLLEIVALVLESGDYLVIHAMKCRSKYYRLLEGR